VSRTGRARRTRALPWAVAATVAGVALTGCGIGQLQLRTAAEVTAQSAASIAVLPVSASGSGKVSPGRPVVVTAESGRLTSVSVMGPEGAIDGRMSPDATSWTAEADSLDYGTTYTVAAGAVDRLGVPTEVTQSLETVTPSKLLTVKVNPTGGEPIGVGIPMKVTFSRPIDTEAAKTKVQERLTVTVNGERAAGGWRWETDTVAYYRLPSYWPGNSTIELTAALKGVNVAKGVWGKETSTHTWTTGDSMVSKVDLKTYTMTVVKNGKVIRTIPITAGKAGYETRSGTKVVLTHETSRRMDAASGGVEASDPEYYNLVVQYAMRVTWSGEFLHGAPWSVGSQGEANVSHGCVGMSLIDAKWLFEQSKIGDVVEFTGSERTMEWDNGIADWNVPFDRWMAGETS